MIVNKCKELLDRHRVTLRSAGLFVVFISTAFVYFRYLKGPNVTQKPGQCWKGNNVTSLSRLDMPLQARYSLEEFLEGPGLTANDKRAACKFVVDEHTPKVHHAMQQLYRCFSWWESNPGRDRYLIMHKQPLDNLFLKGFVDRLRDLFFVRVVNFRVDLKVVRGIIHYGHEDKHGFAMRDSTDSHALRDKSLRYYKLPRTQRTCSSPRVGILNRKVHPTLQNVGSIVHAIEKHVEGNVTFKLSSFESRNYEEQLEFLSETDILVSPHGPQLSGIPFLPNCAHLMEIFPVGYHKPSFFGSLAAVAGVHYTYLYLGSNVKRETKMAMKNADGHEAAWKTSLCPDGDTVARAVRVLIEEWRQCCEAEDAQM